jgi:hypothetical protein
MAKKGTNVEIVVFLSGRSTGIMCSGVYGNKVGWVLYRCKNAVSGVVVRRLCKPERERLAVKKCKNADSPYKLWLNVISLTKK